MEKSPVRLVQLLASVAAPHIRANGKNHPLPGTAYRQAINALSAGTAADDDTPADHITALAVGLAFCIESFSVCTPKK
ncbi:MAG: hypothetical protein ACRD2S_11990, partial [Terriglobales bacterium]